MLFRSAPRSTQAVPPDLRRRYSSCSWSRLLGCRTATKQRRTRAAGAAEVLFAGVGPFEGVQGESIMFSDIANAGSPMDQWDALPSAAKLQILGTIFILEWIGETPSSEPHYMRGGKPGYYPSLKGASASGLVPHPVPFDLFNPFGLLPEQTEEEKARGSRRQENKNPTLRI